MQKTILVTIGLVLIIQLSTLAQQQKMEDTHVPETRAKNTVTNLRERISYLSDSKSDSLFTIFKYYFEDYVTYKNSHNDKMLKKILNIRDQQVKQVLNKDQYLEYEKFMEEVRLKSLQKNHATHRAVGGPH
ncbi:MAG: hypothetical protein K2Q22_06655 [Cytophagales bacterium]|nr:hypothetical protein [Cytophagales bacterium]